MNLFDTLERKQKHTDFNAGAENRFFVSNFGILNSSPRFKGLTRAQKPFDIFRANIVLRALMNKMEIEDTFFNASRLYRRNGELSKAGKAAVQKAVEEAKERMPYMEEDKRKIYVPILGKALNVIYDTDIFRLEEKQFRALQGQNSDALMVDPFDTYGYKIFDSYFTNLILIKATPSSAAFFDYDSLSIYFINYQGRLDTKLCLFDRQIGKRNTNHMMERIVPVVDAYYRDDKEGMIQVLVDKQLVSSRLMFKLSSDENKFFSKLERKYDKVQ
ncbi:MAG: hypothetical protein SPL80_05505 [Bacilli bacterium]|nr:hypothetical protein [Bacilli bacterium]